MGFFLWRQWKIPRLFSRMLYTLVTSHSQMVASNELNHTHLQYLLNLFAASKYDNFFDLLDRFLGKNLLNKSRERDGGINWTGKPAQRFQYKCTKYQTRFWWQQMGWTNTINWWIKSILCIFSYSYQIYKPLSTKNHLTISSARKIAT